jgi:SPP1 gp7 family putative phage head morphogenesis protein
VLLGDVDAAVVLRLAAQQDMLELAWKIRADRFFERITDLVLDSLQKTGKVPTKLPFEEFFSAHAYDVAQNSLRTVNRLPRLPRSDKRLAGPPKGKIPRTLTDLMEQWDAYRKKGKVPPRQREIAKKVETAYVKKIRDFWTKYSEPFREGQVYDQKAARDAIREAGKMSEARAKMIVETETTYYYNEVRRKTYDESPDVTHYLYVAIRDHATTKWCRTRDGIVYKKGDPLLDKETPPVHWNCRSEILPLTPLNPRHRQLIADESRSRRNRSPEPLPKGWGRG